MKLDCMLITDCPVCHSVVSDTAQVRATTKAVKEKCVSCGSLLLVSLVSADTEVIRKGKKHVKTDSFRSSVADNRQL